MLLAFRTADYARSQTLQKTDLDTLEITRRECACHVVGGESGQPGEQA